MFTTPFLVAVLAEAGRPLSPDALRGMQDKLAVLLDVPPARLACRPVLRAPDVSAHLEGFPELSGALHVAPRLVVALEPRPWDEWFIRNLIPYIAWPGDPETDQEAITQALSTKWMDPMLAGHMQLAAREAERVVIVMEGASCPAPKDGVVTIGVGPLSAWQDPAPDYVFRQSVDVSVPVRDENTIVGLSPAVANSTTTRTMSFLCAPDEEEDRRQLQLKTVGWTTLLDSHLNQHVLSVATVLYSPYRRVWAARGLTSLPPVVLAAALRGSGCSAPIQIRQHPKTLQFVHPHEAMERLLTDQMKDVTWEILDVQDVPAGAPVTVNVLETDWKMGASVKDLIHWLSTCRSGCLDKTVVTGAPDIVTAATEAGLATDTAPVGTSFQLAPFPLWPSIA